MADSLSRAADATSRQSATVASASDETGKGFAVVATKVKSLPNQTARATEEITDQISGIQRIAGETATAIQNIAATIRQVSEISTMIASAVEEQGAATHEIARNIQQAAAGTEQVAQGINGINAATRDSNATAEQVLTLSRTLSRHSTELHDGVRAIIDRLHAA